MVCRDFVESEEWSVKGECATPTLALPLKEEEILPHSSLIHLLVT
jgi:hypothetical protein